MNGANPSWKVLWAKSEPRHPLWKHMLDAAAVSLALDRPLEPWSAEQTALIVGLHDIGKADASFQHQVPTFREELSQAGYRETCDTRCRHERLSFRFLRCKLKRAGVDDLASLAIARAVVAHHGYWDESSRDVGPEYAQAQESLYGMLQAAIGTTLPDHMPSDLSAFGIRLAGHLVLCDWIASHERFFTDARLTNIDDPADYLHTAREVANRWVSELELGRNRDEGKAASIIERPRPAQDALLKNDIPPGLVIIEAPMGEGKTEAAWILAEKWRDRGHYGMYMALPTMATSDSLYFRYNQDYLGKLGRKDHTKLVHGMAWLRDEKEPERPPEVGEPGDDRSLAAAWFRPTRRAMLAANGVGTVDQAMLAGMNVKFGFLRLFGLADRVLVIDEVHAYDAYMSAIIGRLLQWCACLKIPIVMLSATLSARQRAAMIEAYGATGGDPGPNAPYPLITVAEPEKMARTIETAASSTRMLKVKTLPGLLGDAKATANLARALGENGGCCCVILNTVKQAQAVYSELKKLPKDQKLLFHSRFTAADRQRITERVLELFGKTTAGRPEKFILVATQVVEQSLDVDFDHMISEFAPVDLLLQRSGRIKRHPRNEVGRLGDGLDQRGEPVLHVLLPKKKERNGQPKPVDFGASEYIYQRYPLLKTLGVLNSVIHLPAQFRPLIEQVYGETLPEDASDDLKKSKAAWDDLQEDLAAQAGEFLLCEPMADEFDPVGHDEVGDDSDDGNGWRARTRLELEDVRVIPVINGKATHLAKGELNRERVKELYLQSVKIPPYYWPAKAAKDFGEPVMGEKKLKGAWLLPVKPNNGWEWQGLRKNSKGKDESYRITYDSTIGLTHGGDK